MIALDRVQQLVADAGFIPVAHQTTNDVMAVMVYRADAVLRHLNKALCCALLIRDDDDEKAIEARIATLTLAFDAEMATVH